MVDDVQRRLAVARRAATAGGERALEEFREDLAVETKTGPTDLVTAADRAAQERVLGVIAETFPDEPVLGEEEGTIGELPEQGAAWIVDPIDGTKNFVRGFQCWTTAVAAVVDGEPVASAVAAPALEDLFAAGDGRATRNGETIAVSDDTEPAEAAVCPTLWWPPERRDEFAAIATEVVHRFDECRRIGSAQLELALVAADGLDATIANVRGAPWDTVAGTHLVRRAGGRVTDLEGERWRHDARGLVASNGGIHEEALAAARAGAAVADAESD